MKENGFDSRAKRLCQPEVIGRIVIHPPEVKQEVLIGDASAECLGSMLATARCINATRHIIMRLVWSYPPACLTRQPGPWEITARDRTVVDKIWVGEWCCEDFIPRRRTPCAFITLPGRKLMILKEVLVWVSGVTNAQMAPVLKIWIEENGRMLIYRFWGPD